MLKPFPGAVLPPCCRSEERSGEARDVAHMARRQMCRSSEAGAAPRRHTSDRTHAHAQGSSVELRKKVAEHMCQSIAHQWRVSSKFGAKLANFWIELKQAWTHFQHWHISTNQHRPKSTNFGRKSAQFDPMSTNIGRWRPNSGRFRPKLAIQFRPDSGCVRTDLGHIRPIFGACSAPGV